MMPRIRSVKPELFKHEGLFEAEIASQLPLRLAFIALFSCCDREGRFRWRPRRLKLDMLPYDEVDMAEVLDALVTHGFIKKYKHGGEWYGCIPSWSRHQCINQREAESDIPAMTEVSSEKQIASNKMEVTEKHPTEDASLVSSHSIPTPLSTNNPVFEYPSTHKNEESLLSILDYEILDVQKEEKEIQSSQSNLFTEKESIKKTNINNEITVEPLSVLTPELSFNNISHACTCDSEPCTCGRERKGREKEREVEGKDNIVAPKSRPSVLKNEIQQIFQHWKTVMNHPHAKLDTKRKCLIAKALSFGYTVQELCHAISGCSITPHNIGDNDRHQRYDGLHVILRDSDQIDRFIHNYHYPPCRLNEAERKTKANIETLQRWMNKKMLERAYERH